MNTVYTVCVFYLGVTSWLPEGPLSTELTLKALAAVAVEGSERVHAQPSVLTLLPLTLVHVLVTSARARRGDKEERETRRGRRRKGRRKGRRRGGVRGDVSMFTAYFANC